MAFPTQLDTAAFRKQNMPTGPIHAAEFPIAGFRRSSDEFVVGAVLDPEPSGDLNHLLVAFRSLHETGKNVRLVIFGNVPAQQRVTLAAAQELNRDILLLGNEQSTHAWLGACDILVSLQKGTPLCVLQAMFSRIPVITAAIRVPEVVQHRRTAIQIRNEDGNDLSQAMTELFEHADRRLTMGVTAAAGIARQYSNTNLSREYSVQGTVEHESKTRWLLKEALFSAVPRSRLIRRGNCVRTQIALTIDDGPDPVFTPRILDILRQYEIKATFFVVGGCAEQYPNIVRRMAEEGHEVGNHSYSHPYFNRLSWRGATQEIKMTCSVLNRILGKKCQLFRPPFGKLSPRSLIPAWVAGQQVVMWSVDLKDYCAQAGAIEAKLAHTSLSSGDIVLYHGVSETALEALPRVIESALEGGRKAVAISELNRP